MLKVMEAGFEISHTPGYGEIPIMKAMDWDAEILLGAWDIEHELKTISDPQERRAVAKERIKELDQSFFDFAYFEIKANGGFGVIEGQKDRVTDLDMFELPMAKCSKIDYVVDDEHEGIYLVIEKCPVTIDGADITFQQILIPPGYLLKMTPTNPAILAN